MLVARGERDGRVALLLVLVRDSLGLGLVGERGDLDVIEAACRPGAFVTGALSTAVAFGWGLAGAGAEAGAGWEAAVSGGADVTFPDADSEAVGLTEGSLTGSGICWVTIWVGAATEACFLPTETPSRKMNTPRARTPRKMTTSRVLETWISRKSLLAISSVFSPGTYRT